MGGDFSDKLRLLLGIFLFAVFAYLILSNVELVRQLAQGYGLVGLFFASMIANATVLLPVPIDLLVIAVNAQSGSIFDVLLVCIVLGAGAGIGEMAAYIAGLLGVETAEKLKKSEFRRIREIREKIERMGTRFIFFAAVIPFPFDIIGLTAGFIKYDPKKFFLAALLGKTVRYVLLGIASYYGFAFVKSYVFL